MSEIKYTRDHEWVKFDEAGLAVIGITDYAQHALGDLVYVELPKVGAKINKGAHFAVVESVKTAAEVYTPVTGEVVEVNSALEKDPEGLKDAENGWIAKFRLTDNAQIDQLMDKAAYEEFLKTL